MMMIIIIIIIAPLTIVKEDQWGDLECLHKACQAAILDGGLFTDTGIDERCENEQQGENDCEDDIIMFIITGLFVCLDMK